MGSELEAAELGAAALPRTSSIARALIVSAP